MRTAKKLFWMCMTALAVNTPVYFTLKHEGAPPWVLSIICWGIGGVIGWNWETIYAALSDIRWRVRS